MDRKGLCLDDDVQAPRLWLTSVGVIVGSGHAGMDVRMLPSSQRIPDPGSRCDARCGNISGHEEVEPIKTRRHRRSSSSTTQTTPLGSAQVPER